MNGRQQQGSDAMFTPICALAIMAALSGATITTFALLVIGIHKGDRGHLANAPQSRCDAFSRRCLIGIRINGREAGK
jgi:hypothetical protein